MARIGEALQCRRTGQDQSFRLKVERDWFNTPHAADFHVSERVVTYPSFLTFNHPESQPDKQPPYIKQLFDIQGVSHVTLTSHTIRVQWAKTFSHKEIIPQVKAVLIKAFTK